MIDGRACSGIESVISFGKVSSCSSVESEIMEVACVIECDVVDTEVVFDTFPFIKTVSSLILHDFL